jgi:predicted nucleotidyltransferase
LKGFWRVGSIDPVDGSNVKYVANLLEGVFRKHNVVLAYLFGSRARGCSRSDSDYDIAVLMDRSEVTVMDEIELALDIADALKVPADRVDVVALNIADTMLKARVLREGAVIYAENEDVRKVWERKVYLEVLDSTDFYAIYIARVFGRLNFHS